jgi:hypothetical protein
MEIDQEFNLKNDTFDNKRKFLEEELDKIDIKKIIKERVNTIDIKEIFKSENKKSKRFEENEKVAFKFIDDFFQMDKTLNLDLMDFNISNDIEKKKEESSKVLEEEIVKENQNDKKLSEDSNCMKMDIIPQENLNTIVKKIEEIELNDLIYSNEELNNSTIANKSNINTFKKIKKRNNKFNNHKI